MGREFKNKWRLNEMNPLVFTDLDGTLLDHDDYSYEAAAEALERIRSRQIPLVFTTSKTRREVERLQAALRIRDPFVVENGAAIFFPVGYRNFEMDAGWHVPPYTIIRLGAVYGEIRRFAGTLKERFNMRGFGDLSVEEIELLSGLPLEQAALAKEREFTEPFIIDDETRIPEMDRIAGSHGFKITSGGRFFHLIGIQQDKGRAVRLCASIFARNTGNGLLTVGLGDSANDIPMLESVDLPILLPHPDGSFEDLDLLNMRKAPYPGSRGWNHAILDVLDTLAEWKSCK